MVNDSNSHNKVGGAIQKIWPRASKSVNLAVQLQGFGRCQSPGTKGGTSTPPLHLALQHDSVELGGLSEKEKI